MSASPTWLIDGLSALLHLLRASLLHCSKPGHRSRPATGINEAVVQLTEKLVPRIVLMNGHDMGLQLYKNLDRATVERIQETRQERLRNRTRIT